MQDTLTSNDITIINTPTTTIESNITPHPLVLIPITLNVKIKVTIFSPLTKGDTVTLTLMELTIGLEPMTC